MEKHPPLPADAGELIPHRPPMRMVSRLLSCGIDDTGVVEAVVCEDNPLLNRDGVLERIALAEILAQSFAAKQGYEDLKKGLSAEQGFLVAIREITCYAAARLGDRLTVNVRLLMKMDPFYLVAGEIYRGEDKLAEGEMKLWVPELKSVSAEVDS